MTRQIVRRNGKRYVLIEPLELRRLERLAAKRATVEMPAWPAAEASGNRPAAEFARASIARTIIESRRSLGISQQELARLSGLRQETISRIESGKQSPTVRTVEKIERALSRATKGNASGSKSRQKVRKA